MRYYLAIIALAALAALALAAAVWPDERYLPEVDDYGYRCEGDCDADVPCRWCNRR